MYIAIVVSSYKHSWILLNVFSECISVQFFVYFRGIDKLHGRNNFQSRSKYNNMLNVNCATVNLFLSLTCLMNVLTSECLTFEKGLHDTAAQILYD